jgi:hypothetical protein
MALKVDIDAIFLSRSFNHSKMADFQNSEVGVIPSHLALLSSR